MFSKIYLLCILFIHIYTKAFLLCLIRLEKEIQKKKERGGEIAKYKQNELEVMNMK